VAGEVRSRGAALSGILPWVLYFVLANTGLPALAVLGALAVSACLTVIPAARGARVKLLDWTALGYFGLAALSLVAGGIIGQMFHRYNLALVWVLFATVVWTSIAIGSPFTLQYAHESAPPEVWNNPLFLHTNRMLSLVWAGIFSTNLAITAVTMGVAGSSSLVTIIVPLALVAGGFLFTFRYTAAAQRRAQGAADAQASARR
jgi:hypothetical protein